MEHSFECSLNLKRHAEEQNIPVPLYLLPFSVDRHLSISRSIIDSGLAEYPADLLSFSFCRILPIDIPAIMGANLLEAGTAENPFENGTKARNLFG
jgi:hypothetical protein